MHLHNLTIRAFSEGLQKKEFTATEMVTRYFEVIKEKDADIGAYLTLFQESRAARASARRSSGCAGT
ncbi:hypothetical protein FJY94_08835 [Candidatus Kaiserbacteria bacterium]|nr:hypothetical protein [Candidatus Kaiserbacteria bacterium]